MVAGDYAQIDNVLTLMERLAQVDSGTTRLAPSVFELPFAIIGREPDEVTLIPHNKRLPEVKDQKSNRWIDRHLRHS